MQVPILGIPITFLTWDTILDRIYARIKSKETRPYFVVTANPEFILHAQVNVTFSHALAAADIILPDGVALAQARYFLGFRPRYLIQKLFLAGVIFWKTIRGAFNQDKITGVSLVNHILEDRNISVFLLGGFDGVAESLGKKYQRSFYEGSPNIHTISRKDERIILKRIKEATPDVLLVAFGHFKQEIWIHQHLPELSCKVVIGVGSTFDELAARGYWARKIPSFFDRSGLKWMWRLFHDHKHFIRVWRAVVIFPLTIAFHK